MPSESLHVKSFALLIQFLLVLLMLLFKQLVQGSLTDLVGWAEECDIFLVYLPSSFFLPGCFPIPFSLGSGITYGLKLSRSIKTKLWRRSQPIFSSVGVQTHIFSENTPKTTNFSRDLGYKDGDMTAPGDSRERGSQRQMLGAKTRHSFTKVRGVKTPALGLCSWIQRIGEKELWFQGQSYCSGVMAETRSLGIPVGKGIVQQRMKLLATRTHHQQLLVGQCQLLYHGVLHPQDSIWVSPLA